MQKTKKTVGRPRKVLSDTEMMTVRRMKNKAVGWRSIANAVSVMRGESVSHMHIKRVFESVHA